MPGKSYRVEVGKESDRSDFDPGQTNGVDIPTVGQWAQRILSDLNVFFAHAETDADAGAINSSLSETGVDLVHSCLTVMEKFPFQSRIAFARSLPFSELEQELMRRTSIQDGHLRRVISGRVIEWANRSPVVIDEANVHVTDFLENLRPMLDRWEEREVVTRAIQRICNY